MERELRQYWTNKDKLTKLEKSIIEESASSGQPSKNSISDPTAAKVIKLTSTRVILYCQERVQYVENVIKKLNTFEKEVFELIFKHGCNFTYCEQVKNINKNTYYNVYNKCIFLLAQEWGLIQILQFVAKF